jgi:RecJ-like exonuclease
MQTGCVGALFVRMGYNMGPSTRVVHGNFSVVSGCLGPSARESEDCEVSGQVPCEDCEVSGQVPCEDCEVSGQVPGVSCHRGLQNVSRQDLLQNAISPA